MSIMNKPQENPRLKKMDLCKSGRPKSLVAQELNRERAKLDDMHVRVTDHVQKRDKSAMRFEMWKQRWKVDRPGEPIDETEYPYKVVPIDWELVNEHNRQHYVIAALEDELEGKDDK